MIVNLKHLLTLKLTVKFNFNLLLHLSVLLILFFTLKIDFIRCHRLLKYVYIYYYTGVTGVYFL